MEEKTPTMAAEPTMAYGVNTYADVMSYLHSITLTPEYDDYRKIFEKVGWGFIWAVQDPKSRVDFNESIDMVEARG